MIYKYMDKLKKIKNKVVSTAKHVTTVTKHTGLELKYNIFDIETLINTLKNVVQEHDTNKTKDIILLLIYVLYGSIEQFTIDKGFNNINKYINKIKKSKNITENTIIKGIKMYQKDLTGLEKMYNKTVNTNVMNRNIRYIKEYKILINYINHLNKVAVTSDLNDTLTSLYKCISTGYKDFNEYLTNTYKFEHKYKVVPLTLLYNKIIIYATESDKQITTSINVLKTDISKYINKVKIKKGNVNTKLSSNKINTTNIINNINQITPYLKKEDKLKMIPLLKKLNIQHRYKNNSTVTYKFNKNKINDFFEH